MFVNAELRRNFFLNIRFAYILILFIHHQKGGGGWVHDNQQRPRGTTNFDNSMFDYSQIAQQPLVVPLQKMIML